MVIDTRLAKLRWVEDEFSQRGAESLEEESKLHKRKEAVTKRVSKAEARMATSLASETRVHGECERLLLKAKTQAMVAKHDTLRALKAREDAVYALHVAVRDQAAKRIQRFVLETSKRLSQPLALRYTVPKVQTKHAVRREAALRIQQVVRAYQARRAVGARARVVFKKMYDPYAGTYYWWNMQQAKAQWSMPAVLALAGDDDDDEDDADDADEEGEEGKDEKEEEKEYGGKQTEKKWFDRGRGEEKGVHETFIFNGVHGKKTEPRIQMTEEESILVIQCSVRCCLARICATKLAKEQFEKLLDKQTGDFYYW
jgi:hypothetical protein